MPHSANISVVVTSYKRDDLLAECLATLVAQDLPLQDVVVVDDGGPGSAKDIVASHGPKFRYVWQPNGHVQAARNTGIRECKGEWIAFLDDDDLWMPWRHRQLQAAIDQTPTPIIASNFVKFANGVDRPESIYDEIELRNPGFFSGIRPTDFAQPFSLVEKFPVERLMPVHPFWPSSLAISRSALQALNGWDQGLRGVKCEDIDFVFRALSRFPITIAWQPSLRYRSHANNDAGDSLANLKGHLFVWTRLLNKEPMPAPLVASIETGMLKLRHELLWEAYARGDFATCVDVFASLPRIERSVVERAKYLFAELSLMKRRRSHARGKR